jgi:hypothetical protein
MSMKKEGILLTAVILLAAVGFAEAQEGELSGTVDFTYLRSFIWRGFDYYGPGEHSAIQPSVDIDLGGTGFGANVVWTRAFSSGFENAERLALSLYYCNSICEGEPCAIDYKVGWVYYKFPDESPSGSSDPDAQAADMQEAFASLSWPDLCPAGVVPSYTVVAMWPAEGSSATSVNSGWAHILGVGYDWTVEGLLPDTPEQDVHLSASLVYNDGLAPGVANINASRNAVDHDWSHAVFGVSTDFELAENLSLTPGFYYQSSWEDTVNTEDEAWYTLSLSYRF